MEKGSASIKAFIFQIIKEKFEGSAFWTKIESDIAVYVSDIVDPINTEKTKQFIKQLTQIKDFLLGHDVNESELSFFDEEIERYEKTKTISLYEDEDDSINDEDVEYYSRHGSSTEGLVGIHLPLNYSQLEKLTNLVFKKTGLIKFYISREKTIYGKIIAEIYEHAQEIPIATLVESRRKNKETGDPAYRKILLFGNKTSSVEHTKVKEVNIPFYVYRFITESNKEMILLSTDQCEIGDYVVTGVGTKCDDQKMLTESAKLPTKLPYFFAQSIMNRIIKFKNHEEFNARLIELDIKRENFYNYPFTIKKDKKLYELLQPDWYKTLIWAWLLHQPKGLFNNYPMHLMVMGPKHSGKSLLLNGLHSKSKEARSIFSGSSSTLKSLVPSFKYNPARLGYLAESNRFAFCDEFFRCLFNTKTTKDGNQREESVAIMNDLLEHQKREAGSGVSRINVNMTSRIIATTNPIRGMSNISDLVNSFDESFLSRWVLYYQTEDHVSMIRHSNDSDLKVFDKSISNNDWVALIDYIHTFSAKYDMARVDEIHSLAPEVLNETLRRHYDARHKHHIECLIDGIIKTRCMLDGDMSFEATEEDYSNLKLVWMKLITSWLGVKDIKSMEVKKRVYYLPESAQMLYWEVVNKKSKVSKMYLKEFALKSMSRVAYFESIMMLKENNLLIEEGEWVRPYFLEEKQSVFRG